MGATGRIRQNPDARRMVGEQVGAIQVGAIQVRPIMDRRLEGQRLRQRG
jgi:hypothetical protein